MYRERDRYMCICIHVPMAHACYRRACNMRVCVYVCVCMMRMTDVNYTGYASDTSKSLGECLRLRSNHNLYLNGRLAE